MSLIVERLEWDTEFFGFNVGRIRGAIGSRHDLERVEGLIDEQGMRLCYHGHREELPSFVHQSGVLDLDLVDRKVTYIKAIPAGLVGMDEHVSVVDDHVDAERLEELAVLSGVYSRFHVDGRIGAGKYAELYRLWMRNSLRGTLAGEVLVYRLERRIAGFVTLGERNGRGDIGLVAVDGSCRGRGVGRALVSSAAARFGRRGHTSVQVVTQGANTPACRLYEVCGFAVEGVEYFYHVWRR